MFMLFNSGWFSSTIGLLGLIVGIIGLYFYFKSKIGALPCYQMKSMRLIGKDEQELPTDVKILYKDSEVPRLTLTRIWLWNGGKETIRDKQIVEDDPIRCVFNDENDKILIANIAATTRTVNKSNVSINLTNEAIINFDFLDPNDGMRIELFHTSLKRYPVIKGTIRGIPKGLINHTTHKARIFDKSFDILFKNRKFIYSVVIIFGIIAILIGLLPSSYLSYIIKIIEAKPKNIENLVIYRTAFITVGLLYSFMPLSTILSKRKKYPSSLDADLYKINIKKVV